MTGITMLPLTGSANQGASVDPVEALKLAIKKLGRARYRANCFKPRHIPVLSPVYTIIRRQRSAHDSTYEKPRDKAVRIRRELLDAGVTPYGMVKSESRVLPKVLRDRERIEAVVYGQHHGSSIMLVATDARIIFVDKKPMLLHIDEVSYEVVSGVDLQINLFTARIILHTPVSNYDVKYANLRCAERFARHIEQERLRRELTEEDGESEPIIRKSRLPAERHEYDYPGELKEDMAGYYLLPIDEDERHKIEHQLEEA